MVCPKKKNRFLSISSSASTLLIHLIVRLSSSNKFRECVSCEEEVSVESNEVSNFSACVWVLTCKAPTAFQNRNRSCEPVVQEEKMCLVVPKTFGRIS